MGYGSTTVTTLWGREEEGEEKGSEREHSVMWRRRYSLEKCEGGNHRPMGSSMTLGGEGC